MIKSIENDAELVQINDDYDDEDDDDDDDSMTTRGMFRTGK